MCAKCNKKKASMQCPVCHKLFCANCMIHGIDH